MVEFLVKVATLQISYDPLPEGYLMAETPLLYQTLSQLDPFETSMISWRKFLIIHSRLLPVDEEVILYTKGQFAENGVLPHKIILKKFEMTSLWFENQNIDPKVEFDWPRKKKHALAGNLQLTKEIFTESAQLSIQSNSDYATKSSDVKASASSTPQHDLKIELFDQDNNIKVEEKVNEIKTATISTIEPKAFNLLDMMLCLCLDESPLNGLKKAFLLFQDDQGKVSKNEINTIFQHFLTPINCGERVQSFMNPFPMYHLTNIFGDKEERITFAEFASLLDKNDLADWLQCPLYTLEVIL
jgi:hypothetical protein